MSGILELRFAFIMEKGSTRGHVQELYEEERFSARKLFLSLFLSLLMPSIYVLVCVGGWGCVRVYTYTHTYICLYMHTYICMYVY